MSEPKVQLVDPQGNMNLPGMNATGVITASSFDGAGGVVTGLTGNPNLNVGVVTATSFVGDGTGHAAGLTGTPNLNLGLTTATSFVGDAVGKAAGLTGTPNLNVGLITASNFVGDVTGDITGNITGNVTGNITGNVTGNVTGIAGSVVQGSNIHVGVATATSLSGDGSSLTGIAATNYNTQTITIGSATTTIDLSAGNVITLDQQVDTTVSLANTSSAMDVTIIRPGGGGNWNVSYSTGGVEFDGNGDYLSLASTSDFDFESTPDFTIELWAKFDGYSGSPYFFDFRADGSDTGTTNRIVWYTPSSSGKPTFWKNGSVQIAASSAVSTGTWSHYALVRKQQTTTMYINGEAQGSVSDSTNYQSTPLVIGQRQGSYASQSFDGVLSNIRIVKGTAVYTQNFIPPKEALTNITGTKLLCCQSTTDVTAKAVGNTITSNGDPAAGSQTIASSGTYQTRGTITWPESIQWTGGVSPDWNNPTISTEWNQFQLLTRDSGVTWYGWQNAETELSAAYSLWTWGCAEGGMLGHNSPQTQHLSSPTQIPGVWSHINVKRDQRKTVHATKANGTLWAWGNGQYGLQGVNDTVWRSSPIQVGTETTWSLQNIGGANQNTVMTKTDGTLWGWGGNQSGSLGLNSSSSNARKSSPTQIGTDTTWKTTQNSILKTNYEFVAATKTDGTLWIWGKNEYGELGQNSINDHRSSPVQIPGTNWNTVGGTQQCIFGIKTDGTLWGWGRGSNGRLGINQPTNSHRSSPTQIPGSWSDISSGGYGQINAVKTEGTLWSWGYGYYGSFGINQGGGVKRSSPTQIGTNTNWNQSTAALGPFSIATKTDGTLWAWGRNSDSGGGNLGQNDRTNESSPKQVGGNNTWRYSWGAFAASFALRDAE